MGGDAYVYQCNDCEVTVHGRSKSPYTSNRMYAGSEVSVIKAWHVGVDTGAPWHQDRVSCDVEDEIEAARDEMRQSSGDDWY